MSRWAADQPSDSKTDSHALAATEVLSEVPSSSPGGAELYSSQPAPDKSSRPRIPVWLRVVPFFLSALFFLSAFFAVFSPLPILMMGLRALSLRSARVQATFAVLTNSLIVGMIGGGVSLAIYAIFVVAPCLAILEVLSRAASPSPTGRRVMMRDSVEKAAFAALGAMTVASAVAGLVYFQLHHASLWIDIRNSVSAWIDYISQARSAGTATGGMASAIPVDPAEFEAWKQGLLVELPSAIAILALVLIWVNLTVVLRANPRSLRQRLLLSPDYFQTWKAPEYLVWPTILAGATLLLKAGWATWATDSGRNFFKFFMAVYAIQGLSILSFFFELWKLPRFLRLIGYLVAVVVMMPLLLGLGFFDLWFDFRGKFRQSYPTR